MARFSVCAASDCNSTRCGHGFTARRRTAPKRLPVNPRCWRHLAMGRVDADTQLVPSWRLGHRDLATATDFVDDLAQRVKGRIQLTTDPLRPYVNVIETPSGGRPISPNFTRSIALLGDPEARYSPAAVHRLCIERRQRSPRPAARLYELLVWSARTGLSARPCAATPVLVMAFLPQAGKSRRCDCAKLLRVQLHQDSPYPARDSGNGRWRSTDRLWDVADLVTLWESYEPGAGKGGVSEMGI